MCVRPLSRSRAPAPGVRRGRRAPPSSLAGDSGGTGSYRYGVDGKYDITLDRADSARVSFYGMSTLVNQRAHARPKPTVAGLMPPPNYNLKCKCQELLSALEVGTDEEQAAALVRMRKLLVDEGDIVESKDGKYTKVSHVKPLLVRGGVIKHLREMVQSPSRRVRLHATAMLQTFHGDVSSLMKERQDRDAALMERVHDLRTMLRSGMSLRDKGRLERATAMAVQMRLDGSDRTNRDSESVSLYLKAVQMIGVIDAEETIRAAMQANDGLGDYKALKQALADAKGKPCEAKLLETAQKTLKRLKSDRLGVGRLFGACF